MKMRSKFALMTRRLPSVVGRQVQERYLGLRLHSSMWQVSRLLVNMNQNRRR